MKKDTKGLDGSTTPPEHWGGDQDGFYRKKGNEFSLSLEATNKLMESFKKLYLKAMYDLDTAGVITFHDRDLIEESVGDGKPFPTFYALAEVYRFTSAEISNIRSRGRKMKSMRIRILLEGLEKLKRNEK